MKRIYLLGLVLCLSGYLAPTLAQAAAAPLGIIGALDEEIQSIQHLMENIKEVSVNQRTIYQGTIHNKPVVVIKSGIGKANAAATIQLLVTKFEVREAVFTGVAGGVDPKKQIGDVVIGKCMYQHDYGMVTPTGKMVWRAGTLPFKPVPISELCFDLSRSSLYHNLRVAAYRVKLDPVPAGLAKEGSYRPTIKVGNIVTGDEFISSEAKRKWLEETFNAAAVEMEGAAMAQICEANQISCVVIRTLSDRANESAHVDFQKLAAFAAQNSAKLMDVLLKSYQGGKL